MSKSIYDDIKTPKELVTSVIAHGLSTKIDDICRAQDIFGRAPIEDLVALANYDEAAANRDGHSHGYQSTFYSILFTIWNWEDATRFYNQHTNPEYKRLKVAEASLRDATKTHAELSERLSEANKQKSHLEHQVETLSQTLGDEKAHTAELERTIMELKAKLYDLMTQK